MRMRGAAKASAKSSARLAILLTRTRVRPVLVSINRGSTPNCVIVGPRLISTTRDGAPNDVRVSSIRFARSLSMLLSILIVVAGSRIVFISGSFQCAALEPCVTEGFKRADSAEVCWRLGWLVGAGFNVPEVWDVSAMGLWVFACEMGGVSKGMKSSSINSLICSGFGADVLCW